MGEVRLQKGLSQLNPGGGSWEPPGPKTRGSEGQVLMGHIPCAVPCSLLLRLGQRGPYNPGQLVTKPCTGRLSITSLQSSSALLTDGAQGQKKDQLRNGGQRAPTGA